MQILIFCQLKQKGYNANQKISLSCIFETFIEIIKLTNKNIPKTYTSFCAIWFGKYTQSHIRKRKLNKTKREFGFKRNTINSLKELLLKANKGK